MILSYSSLQLPHRTTSLPANRGSKRSSTSACRRARTQQLRTDISCSFQPFGRDVFGSEIAQKAQEELDEEQTEHEIAPQRPLSALIEDAASSAGLVVSGSSPLITTALPPRLAERSGFGPQLPEPEITLVSRFKQSPKQNEQYFWSQFVNKCRLAWDVFFPDNGVQVLTPAGAVKSRLQMILVSDRCGLDLPTLMRIKQNSMAMLAQDQGWEGVTELEVQVASFKASGERITMSLPLHAIPDMEALRDPDEYHYEEELEDDEEEVADLLEASGQFSTTIEAGPMQQQQQQPKEQQQQDHATVV